MKSVVIAGTHSGSGKTTVTLGILAALRKRGIKTQPFKVGPDYIDTAYHSFISGRKSRNLDGWMLAEDVLKYVFEKNSTGVEVSIIEGVMGMFDGLDSKDFTGSTAHIAKTLKTPVVLVVDGSSMGASAAAVVMGYSGFDRDVKLAGVIFNNLGSESHYHLLKDAVENTLDVKVLGYLPRTPGIELPQRHLGLLPVHELKDVKHQLSKLAHTVETHIDLDMLLKISHVPNVNKTSLHISTKEDKKVKIAVAMDEAFNFYYHDNLDLLEDLGAELKFFSPLQDETLPDEVSGIYIGGGFPEVFASQLEANISMRNIIKKASFSGMPVYAECGGLMYMVEEIVDLEGKSFKGVGVFKAAARMTSRLQRFGYINLEFLKNTPIADKGLTTKGHEFHHSVVELKEKPQYGYKATKAGGRNQGRTWMGGLMKHNTLAGYAHLHFYSNPRIAKNFVENCAAYKELRGGKQ